MAHRAPRRSIGGIHEHPWQGAHGPRQRLEHEGPGERPTDAADERLDELRDAVEPGGRHRRPVAAGGQVRIDDDGARHHEGTAEALLEAPPRAGDDGIPRRLGAGAGRRRHGEQRQRRDLDRDPPPHPLEPVDDERIVGLGAETGGEIRGEGRDGLGQIDRRSPPDGDDDDPISPPRRERGEGPGDVGHGRLAGANGDKLGGKAGAPEARLDR